MLSVATPRKLFFGEAANIKRSAVALFPVSDLPKQPTASAWAPDGASLYLASAHSVSRYAASGPLIKVVYDDAECEPIHAIIAKDKGTLIFAAGPNVHSLEHSASASSSSKIVHTLPVHPDTSAPVIALSLSNDNTLLAVASPHAILVHNLSLGVHTVLRGLPADAPVNACVFHPHSRVRLFLGIKRELVVYDITRPSGPSRVIPMSDSAEGDVVAIACSPYSKTLLAVACAGGYVAMVDLDKEKGRIRSFNYGAGLTSLAFAPDGATLFVGTESGQVLVQTLRAVEAPKTVEVGERVESLAITKKLKPSAMESPTLKQSVGSPPAKPQDTTSPRRTLAKDGETLNAAAPLTRTDSPEPLADGKITASINNSARKRVSSTTVLGSKKAFDAARNLFAGAGVARSDGGQAVSPSGLRKIKPAVLEKTADKGGAPDKSGKSPVSSKSPSRVSPTRPRVLSSAGTTIQRPGARSRTVSVTGPSVATTRAALLKSPSTQQARPRVLDSVSPSGPAGRKSPSLTRTSTEPTALKASARTPARARTTSMVSRGTTTTASSSRPTSSSGASARTASTRATSMALTAREHSPIPPVPRIPKVKVINGSQRACTPSPELLDELPPFDIDNMPTPPRKGLSMLGLGTPEVARWIDSESQDKGKGPAKPDAEPGEREEIEDVPAPARRERAVSMQLTPGRASMGAGWAPSPLRNTIAGGSPGAQNVQTMLHSLIKDAMLDVRQDVKGEMVGLHLDLVRMGRAWRQEIRGTMEEYLGDIRELREENKKLRDENERLRRGY